MRNNLVVVYDLDEGQAADYARYLNTRRGGTIVPLEVVGKDYETDREYSVYECAEDSVDSAVETLSTMHPDKEIRVYRLTGINYREPGPLRSKVVNENGVLPNE